MRAILSRIACMRRQACIWHNSARPACRDCLMSSHLLAPARCPPQDGASRLQTESHELYVRAGSSQSWLINLRPLSDRLPLLAVAKERLQTLKSYGFKDVVLAGWVKVVVEDGAGGWVELRKVDAPPEGVTQGFTTCCLELTPHGALQMRSQNLGLPVEPLLGRKLVRVELWASSQDLSSNSPDQLLHACIYLTAQQNLDMVVGDLAAASTAQESSAAPSSAHASETPVSAARLDAAQAARKATLVSDRDRDAIKRVQQSLNVAKAEARQAEEARDAALKEAQAAKEAAAAHKGALDQALHELSDLREALTAAHKELHAVRGGAAADRAKLGLVLSAAAKAAAQRIKAAAAATAAQAQGQGQGAAAPAAATAAAPGQGKDASALPAAEQSKGPQPGGSEPRAPPSSQPPPLPLLQGTKRACSGDATTGSPEAGAEEKDGATGSESTQEPSLKKPKIEVGPEMSLPLGPISTSSGGAPAPALAAANTSCEPAKPGPKPATALPPTQPMNALLHHLRTLATIKLSPLRAGQGPQAKAGAVTLPGSQAQGSAQAGSKLQKPGDHLPLLAVHQQQQQQRLVRGLNAQHGALSPQQQQQQQQQQNGKAHVLPPAPTESIPYTAETFQAGSISVGTALRCAQLWEQGLDGGPPIKELEGASGAKLIANCTPAWRRSCSLDFSTAFACYRRFITFLEDVVAEAQAQVQAKQRVGAPAAAAAAASPAWDLVRAAQAVDSYLARRKIRLGELRASIGIKGSRNWLQAIKEVVLLALKTAEALSAATAAAAAVAAAAAGAVAGKAGAAQPLLRPVPPRAVAPVSAPAAAVAGAAARPAIPAPMLSAGTPRLSPAVTPRAMARPAGLGAQVLALPLSPRMLLAPAVVNAVHASTQAGAFPQPPSPQVPPHQHTQQQQAQQPQQPGSSPALAMQAQPHSLAAPSAATTALEAQPAVKGATGVDAYQAPASAADHEHDHDPVPEWQPCFTECAPGLFVAAKDGDPLSEGLVINASDGAPQIPLVGAAAAQTLSGLLQVAQPQVLVQGEEQSQVLFMPVLPSGQLQDPATPTAAPDSARACALASPLEQLPQPQAAQQWVLIPHGSESGVQLVPVQAASELSAGEEGQQLLVIGKLS